MADFLPLPSAAEPTPRPLLGRVAHAASGLAAGVARVAPFLLAPPVLRWIVRNVARPRLGDQLSDAVAETVAGAVEKIHGLIVGESHSDVKSDTSAESTPPEFGNELVEQPVS